MSFFSSNGSPTCTDGRFVSLRVVEPCRREHARATDPVPPGRGAEQDCEVPDSFSAREHEPVHREHTQTQHVHQRVASVAVVEDELAAHRRDADRVAVAADAADDTFEQVPRARIVEWPEPEWVHERDRPRPHREDVADDPADARRRALVRLDGRWMVVTLDAHRDREAVAHVDHARALTRADEHPRRLGGKASEVRPGRLVRAVLGPHHRVHRELEVGRLAFELGHHGGELVVGHSELTVQRLRHSASLTKPNRPTAVRVETAKRLVVNTSARAHGPSDHWVTTDPRIDIHGSTTQAADDVRAQGCPR